MKFYEDLYGTEAIIIKCCDNIDKEGSVIANILIGEGRELLVLLLIANDESFHAKIWGYFVIFSCKTVFKYRFFTIIERNLQ